MWRGLGIGEVSGIGIERMCVWVGLEWDLWFGVVAVGAVREGFIEGLWCGFGRGSGFLETVRGWHGGLLLERSNKFFLCLQVCQLFTPDSFFLNASKQSLLFTLEC